MSGGVDSSVAAILLKKQGYDVFGVFMKFWSDPKLDPKSNCENKCCSEESRLNAMRVAKKFNFPLYTINVKSDFKKLIVDYFINGYASGITPNPCVACNKLIKFDILLKKVKKLGAAKLATGHYAKILNKKNKYYLYRGLDEKKDQSYFLYNLSQTQLKNILFPLSNYNKDQIRKIATKHKIPQAKIKDSQDICFAPRKNHEKFLKKYIPKKYLKPGNIINLDDGEVLGKHDGLPLFTFGQRSGLKIGGTGPYYVIDFNKNKNELLVSKNSNHPNLLKNEFKIKNINWISEQPKTNIKYNCQIRYQAKPVKATISKDTPRRVLLDKKLRAIAPGQSAVFYKGRTVLGGGVIANI